MGIFDSEVGIFATYRAEIRFRDRVMGGIPKDPKLIEGWLRNKAGLTDDAEELRQATLRTLLELGADVRPGMTFAELEEASRELAAVKQTNGFKLDEGGLYLEARALKACIKESTNILFAGEKRGSTRKGPKSFVAERVFVNPDKIPLGVAEPDGVDLFIGHTNGPKGLQSNLTYYEYVTRPTLRFEVMVTRDSLSRKQWMELWVQAQEVGLGALRSQGCGRFDLEAWELIRGKEREEEAA